MGECKGESEDYIEITGALDIMLSNDNHITLTPMVPKGITWDEVYLRDAVTRFQKRHILSHVSMPMHEGHELCKMFEAFWEPVIK